MMPSKTRLRNGLRVGISCCQTHVMSISVLLLVSVLHCLPSTAYAFMVNTPSSIHVARATTTLWGKYDQAEKEEKAKNLYRDLDETFNYEGRLPAAPAAVGPTSHFRCGFVGIVGAPNIGKSTLLNALIDTDLCVATNRPQTTRHSILGVLTTDHCQLCFLDTPGVIENPAYKLQEGMMEAVKGALKDAEVLLVVTDLFSTPIPDDNLFAQVQKSTHKPAIVVINKVDLADKVNPDAEANDEDGRTVTVFDAVSKWRGLLPNAMAIIPVCASAGPNDKGVEAIRRILTGGPDVPAAIRELGRPIPGMFPEGVKFITDEEAQAILPTSPPLYDEDTLTDRSERFFASEMIRATLFEKLKKEMPYCCEVRVTEFKEPKPGDKNPAIRMKATILVERDSQKGIVVGKGGQKIKEVGVDARKKLEDFFQERVHLDLFVKVDKDWRRNEKKLKEYGYLKKK